MDVGRALYRYLLGVAVRHLGALAVLDLPPTGSTGSHAITRLHCRRIRLQSQKPYPPVLPVAGIDPGQPMSSRTEPPRPGGTYTAPGQLLSTTDALTPAAEPTLPPPSTMVMPRLPMYLAPPPSSTKPLTTV